MATSFRHTYSIPSNVYDYIMEQSASGKIAVEIKKLLKTNYDVDTSVQSINKLINKLAAERKDIAKAIYAEAVSKSANKDILIIDDMINKFYIETNKALNEKHPIIATRTADTLLKFQDRRLRLSGIDKEDAKDDDSLLDSLLDKLGK
jgi:hypothetical protein